MPTAPRAGTQPRRIRVIAIGLVFHEDHVLVAEGFDSVKDERFYRALGGEVKFGEAATAAVVRELLEELDRETVVRELLGVIENLFMLEGAPGHEVVFEYLVAFAPGAAPPDLEPLTAREGEATFTARWLSLPELLAGTHRVYPEGVEERLAAWINRR